MLKFFDYLMFLWDGWWHPMKTPLVIPKPIELPPKMLFDWQRDYAPLWEPGSTAFWLEPEPGDLPAGKWPLPFVKERPVNFNQSRRAKPILEFEVRMGVVHLDPKGGTRIIAVDRENDIIYYGD
jgi:hypothetical protein